MRLRSETGQDTPATVTLPARLEVLIAKHMSRDEVILWYEQPEPSIFATYLTPNWMVGIFLVLGCVPLALQLLLLLESGRSAMSPQFLLGIVGPLILIAAPFIRIYVGRLRATTVHYVVTNRRGFIIENLNVKVLTARDAATMEVVNEKAGLTSLIFRRDSRWMSLMLVRLPVGFLGIAKAHEVKRIISQHWRRITLRLY